jgi:hypothetical protein
MIVQPLAIYTSVSNLGWQEQERDCFWAWQFGRAHRKDKFPV